MTLLNNPDMLDCSFFDGSFSVSLVFCKIGVFAFQTFRLHDSARPRPRQSVIVGRCRIVCLYWLAS